ncbi:hypothetical protein HJB77_03335 [Rhizobium lentis]|uniref:hypothetical protein n=1 Tax=Rhizobium lentis TaxID=1138194 RepID=UPI001C83905D|nr:hypothetical protein [Rhizobium lentis]MBX5175329.1 hypothetical protein [Rhizobium lentis]
MKPLLSSDSTIRSVKTELKDAMEYVRSAFGNMAGYHKDCQIRLALDSSPRFPDYLVEMLFYDDEDGQEIVRAQTMAVFSGRTHKGELLDDKNISRPWSSQAMSYLEVRTLVGELRGILPPS